MIDRSAPEKDPRLVDASLPPPHSKLREKIALYVTIMLLLGGNHACDKVFPQDAPHEIPLVAVLQGIENFLGSAEETGVNAVETVDTMMERTAQDPSLDSDIQDRFKETSHDEVSPTNNIHDDI